MNLAQLLDALSSGEMTPQAYEDAARRSQNIVLGPPDEDVMAQVVGRAAATLPRIGGELMARLGIMPRAGEPLYAYWQRNWPSLPPGLRQKQRTEDIALPPERGSVAALRRKTR